MRLTPLALPLLLLAAPTRADAPYHPSEGQELVGTRAPEFRALTWLQGGPHTLASLRGKPILIRFWTDGCPYCEHSAPALRAIDERYRPRGLVVLGIHHPKSAPSHDPATILAAVRALGLPFPIATDPSWTTVRSYGVGTHLTHFTSVSFLIDQKGIIRWLHDGGELHESTDPAHSRCNAAYSSLLEAIDRLLPPKHARAAPRKLKN